MVREARVWGLDMKKLLTQKASILKAPSLKQDVHRARDLGTVARS